LLELHWLSDYLFIFCNLMRRWLLWDNDVAHCISSKFIIILRRIFNVIWKILTVHRLFLLVVLKTLIVSIVAALGSRYSFITVELSGNGHWFIAILLADWWDIILVVFRRFFKWSILKISYGENYEPSLVAVGEPIYLNFFKKSSEDFPSSMLKLAW